MPQIFTITNTASFVFTATVLSPAVNLTQTTSSFSVNKVGSQFTATVAIQTQTVTSTDTYVIVNTATISKFTASVTDFTIGVVEQTIANVAVTNTPSPVEIQHSTASISITYNPSLVEHIYDGQPVYTTSSVQFRSLTLGNTSTFTFPADDGINGQALFTDGDGNMYWGAAGGGPGFWSLNSDLITNGFKIDSGSSTVELSIIAAGAELLLDNHDTRLSHPVGSVRFKTSGTTATQLTYDFFPLVDTKVELTRNRAVVRGSGAAEITVEEGNNQWFGKDIVLGHNTSTVTASNDLHVLGDIYLNEIKTNQPYVFVPSLRFGDGSILSSANQAGTGTGSIYSLQQDLYTNGYIIKGNDTNASLLLQQGLGEFSISGLYNFLSARYAGPAGAVNNLYIDSNRLQLNYLNNNLESTGTGYLNITGLGTGSQIIVGATTATFITTQPVRFEGGIQFADGTVQMTAGGGTSTAVRSIVAGAGISATTVGGVATITNTGVRSIRTSTRGILARTTSSVTATNTTTGDLYLDLDLPIYPGWAVNVVQDTTSTQVGVNTQTLFSGFVAGNGIILSTATANKLTISVSTITLSSVLQGDLLTKGYKIDGETNNLTIEGGKFSFLGSTLTSRISMPRNAPMEISSDFGIKFDSPDNKPIEIFSPFTVSHRSGQSELSMSAIGQTNLKDSIVAITATTRVIVNKSVFSATSVNLYIDDADAYLSLGTTSTLAGKSIKLASTGTVKVGSSIYTSKLGVQDITNYNETGPVTVSRGIQFADLSVQRTAYQSNLNFGVINAPSQNPQDFFLQLTAVDFGTITSPSTYGYDGGSI